MLTEATIEVDFMQELCYLNVWFVPNLCNGWVCSSFAVSICLVVGCGVTYMIRDCLFNVVFSIL